jgi:hypothetical protein
LKRYFTEHPRDNLPDFADKVDLYLMLKLEIAEAIAGYALICLRCQMMSNCLLRFVSTFDTSRETGGLRSY